MESPSKSRAPRKGRWQIIILCVLSAIPIFSAWYFAANPELLTKRSNYGELIVPPKPLNLTDLLRSAKAGDHVAGLIHHWILLRYQFDPCESTCLATLAETQKMWLLLHKDALRVRRVVLLRSDDASDIQQLMAKDPALTVLRWSPETLRILQNALGEPPLSGTTYLIDPLENLMMRYPNQLDGRNLLKDIKHLLRASQIG